MSSDMEQECFSNGLIEDLITELTRFSELRVLARNTTFLYKGQSVDVREIGRKVDSDYVLEGSARRSNEWVRITAQLIDIADGTHVWVDRFDRKLTDIFAVQDEIAGKIVAVLAGAGGSQGVIDPTRLDRAKR